MRLHNQAFTGDGIGFPESELTHSVSVHRLLKAVLLLFLAFGLSVPGVAAPRTARATAGGHAEIYLLRGFADVFSRGLDAVAATLQRQGVKATVLNHNSWGLVARRIIADQARFGRRPVVLVGHSLGANAIIRIAERLKQADIAVQYMATLAATDPDPVPSNVGRVDNYFFETNGWGRKLTGGKGFSGTLRNRDYSHSHGVGHFNMTEQPAIQRELVRNIARYAHGS